MSYSDFIVSVLQDASVIANEKFGKITGTTKGNDNNQVLTEADLVIGKYIVEKINAQFPDYNVIDEEAGILDKRSEFTWVVDPIDGTSNFANGVPTYGIMMGLIQKDKPIAGGFVLPATKEMCIAEKEKGVFLNNEKISITTETKLSNCLLAYHIDGHPEDLERAKQETEMFGTIIKEIRNMRNTGCEPWDGLLVATGKYGGLVNQSMKIWDVVTMHCIIEEAGGLYTDFWGKSIDYTDPLKRVSENFTCCAAAPELHKQLQKIIHQKEN